MEDASVITLVQSLRDKLTSDPPPPPQKILRILQKLSVLPISIDVLSETGIGKVVNGFRKHEDDIAECARSLVWTWKAKVREAMDEEASRQETSETPSQAAPQTETNKVLKTHSPSKQQSTLPHHSASHSASHLHSPKQNSNAPQPAKSKVKSQSTSHSSPHSSSKSHDSKSHDPLRSSNSSKSSYSSKSHDSSESHESSKLRVSSKSRDLSKSHDLSHDSSRSGDSSKSHSRSHDSSKSHDLSKSRDPSKHSTELKRHRDDSIPREGFTQLKSHSPSSGSPVKKLKSHDSPGSGMARVHDKKDVASGSGKPKTISSETRSDTITHKPHDRSYDRSHDWSREESHHKTSLSGSQRSRDGKHPHNSETDKQSDGTPSNPEFKKLTKSLASGNPTTNGSVVSKKSTPTKSLKISKSSDAAKIKPKAPTGDKRDSSKKPKSATSSSKKNKNRDIALEDDMDDDTSESRDFSNTGMSFGDCLLGPMVTKVKKVAKSKTSENSKLSSKSATSSSTKSTMPGRVHPKSSSSVLFDPSKSKGKVEGADPVRSKFKVGKSDPSKANAKTESLKHEKSSQRKYSVSGSSFEDQSSSKGQRSEEGQRNRKKRSISEEDEEAMKLAKKTRRESIEVSLTLPVIQPDYKPMRLPEILSPAKKRTLTAEEEMAFLGSKQGRTKVFSGRSRINRLTSVPRLYDICMDILCDNIDAIDDVGGVPYDILHPVLQRCTPQQLFHLEDCNPHFLEDSDPLWQKHAERDFRGKRPGEMESWRELYIREHDAREARLKSITANITAQMAAKDPGRLTKMAFLDRPAKPPRNVMRQQLRHGTASGSFIPEKRSHSTVQPNRPTTIVHSSGLEAAGTSRRQAKPKVKAPMMMKTLKMIKKLHR